MAVVTIGDIDDRTETRLRVRAALNGRTIEEEVRDILHSALSAEDSLPQDLGRRIHGRFVALGGVDLPDVPRETGREPPDFGA